MNRSLHAVIGIKHRGSNAYYVKRSVLMENYPGVWSLLSIQFLEEELPDQLDLTKAQPLFERMSTQRLGGAPIKVTRYITSGTCSDNPMQQRVHLHLYEIDFPDGSKLNPDFYTDAAWLSPSEYEQRAEGATCGFCMQLWSDWAFRQGLCTKRFAPVPKLEKELSDTGA